MKILKRLWCALRGHPYPVIRDEAVYQDWVLGNVPFAPLDYCSHCGTNVTTHNRGTQS